MKYNIAAKKSKFNQREILWNHFAAACPQRSWVMVNLKKIYIKILNIKILNIFPILYPSYNCLRKSKVQSHRFKSSAM